MHIFFFRPCGPKLSQNRMYLLEISAVSLSSHVAHSSDCNSYFHASLNDAFATGYNGELWEFQGSISLNGMESVNDGAH